MKYILVFTVFFLTLSCNEAFDIRNPYKTKSSFNSEEKRVCSLDSDCKEEGYFCDTASNLCVNPCDAVNHCGEYGTCTSSSLTAFTCSCDNQYYENENHQCVSCEAGEMIDIPAGTFLMGCPSSADDACSEATVRTVTLSAYKIDKNEVTVSQFRKCVTTGGCSAEHFETNNDESSDNYGNNERDNHPMNGVNWFGAKEYCEWAGKRLPTEAEWEYAAKGNSNNDDSKKYPWGDESPDCDKAVYYECNENHTSETGNKESGRSYFGLYDMAGNVSEWVEDCYKADDLIYKTEPITNPLYTNCNSNQEMVYRGGGWLSDPNSLNTYDRKHSRPSYKSYTLGFRCARSQ